MFDSRVVVAYVIAALGIDVKEVPCTRLDFSAELSQQDVYIEQAQTCLSQSQSALFESVPGHFCKDTLELQLSAETEMVMMQK